MGSEIKKSEVVVKIDEYMLKKDKIRESQANIELKSDNNIEKTTELLKSMFSEFLESDIMPILVDNHKDEDEVLIDKDDNICINNVEKGNYIRCDNCKEVEIMKIKANQEIPKAIIVYLIFSTIAFTIFTTIFTITILKKVFIISLESCIVGIISTFGLLLTSIISIRDWRKFIKNV